MLTQERLPEDFSASRGNTLEIMLDKVPGWTMGIGGESSEINHQDFGRYLVEEEGFASFVVFDGGKNFSSVLLAFVEDVANINVYIPHPRSRSVDARSVSLLEKPDVPILESETYYKRDIQLTVNLF